MLLKHFNEIKRLVPDPNRPGYKTQQRSIEPSGTIKLTHQGETYEADANGWFELPHEVAQFLQGRPGWFTSVQVDEEVAVGNLEYNDSPISASPAKPKVAPKPRSRVGK